MSGFEHVNAQKIIENRRPLARYNVCAPSARIQLSRATETGNSAKFPCPLILCRRGRCSCEERSDNLEIDVTNMSCRRGIWEKSLVRASSSFFFHWNHQAEKSRTCSINKIKCCASTRKKSGNNTRNARVRLQLPWFIDRQKFPVIKQARCALSDTANSRVRQVLARTQEQPNERSYKKKAHT